MNDVDREIEKEIKWYLSRPDVTDVDMHEPYRLKQKLDTLYRQKYAGEIRREVVKDLGIEIMDEIFHDVDKIEIVIDGEGKRILSIQKSKYYKPLMEAIYSAVGRIVEKYKGKEKLSEKDIRREIVGEVVGEVLKKARKLKVAVGENCPIDVISWDDLKTLLQKIGGGE